MLAFLMKCALGVNLYYQFNILLIIISLLSPVFLRVKMHHSCINYAYQWNIEQYFKKKTEKVQMMQINNAFSFKQIYLFAKPSCAAHFQCKKTFRTKVALKAQFFFKTKKIEMNSICRHFRFHFVFGLFKLLILITRWNTRHHFETWHAFAQS